MSRGLSQRAHHKVLEAATNLFAERGIDATSVDAIAAESGVSKATVYKHWADKDALCLEVLVHVHELDEGPPELDSGDLREDLKAFLKYEPSPKKAAIQKRLMPHLIAYSARNEQFGRAWKTRVMERSRDFLRKLLRRGVDREWLAEGTVNSFWKAHARTEFQEHSVGKEARHPKKLPMQAAKLKQQKSKEQAGLEE